MSAAESVCDVIAAGPVTRFAGLAFEAVLVAPYPLLHEGSSQTLSRCLRGTSRRFPSRHRWPASWTALLPALLPAALRLLAPALAGPTQGSDATNRVTKAAGAYRFMSVSIRRSILRVDLIHRVGRAGAVAHGATLAERSRVGEEMRGFGFRRVAAAARARNRLIGIDPALRIDHRILSRWADSARCCWCGRSSNCACPRPNRSG